MSSVPKSTTDRTTTRPSRTGEPRQQRPKSRGNGEGAIYKRTEKRTRADGTVDLVERWCAAITLEDGRRKVLYGRTREDVARKLRAGLSQKDGGLPFVPERLTAAEWLAYWLEEVARPNVEPKTWESYELNVRLHLAPALGKRRLARLQPEHVETLLRAMTAAGKSPRTVQYAHAILRNCLGQALRRGYVARNVALLVDPPKQVRPKARPPRVEDVRRLLGLVRGDRLEALVTVALALGLRRGEALGLRWEDVDLVARTLSVRTTVQRIQGIGLTVKDGAKTERSARTVYLPSVLVQALESHWLRQLDDWRAAGSRWQGSDYRDGRRRGFIFTSTVGTLLEPRNVSRSFDRIRQQAGLDEHRFHDLRHDFASLLLVQNVAPRVVMEMLGHTTVALTLNRYTHVPDALQREAADRMDALLVGPDARN